MASLNTNTLTASEQAELDALNSTGLTPAEQAELDALNNVVVKKQPQPTTQQFGANSDIFKIPTFNKPVTTTEVATRTPVGTPTQKELITGNYLVNTKKKVPDFAVLGKGTPVEQTQQPIQENQNPYYVDITAKQDNLAPKNVKAQGIPYINPKMVVESMDTESLLNTDINTMKKFMDAGKDTKQIEFEKESANNNIVNKYGKEMSVYEMQIGELQKRAKQHEDVLKMKYGEDFFKAINTESDNLKYQTQQFQSYTTKRKKEYNSLIADLDEIKNQVQSGEIDQTQGEVAYNAKVAQIKAIEQDISGRQQQISQKQEEFIKKADDEDFNNYIRINGKINDLYNESGQLITKPEFKEYRDLMDAGDEAQKQRDAIESFAFPLTLTQKIQGEFNKLLGRTAEMGASALKMLKSNVPFQDESKYDIVDKIFDKAVEWSKEKQILNPVATSQQRDINQKFADVDGYKVLINDEGNPTEVRTDKFKKIDAKTEQGILDKYTKNPKAYPKQTDFSISNLVTKSVPTILDMAELISITALTGGGSAAMVGTAAAQMYSGIYQQGLEAGLKPQEASDFATMTSLMMGSVSLVNPMESNIAKGIAGKSVGRFFGNAITKADVQLIRTGEMTLMDKAKRFAIESAKNIAGENLEELVLEPFAQNVTQTVYNEKAKQNGGGFETNWNTLQGKQAAETAMITTMTSLFMTPIELSNSMPEQHKIALQRALDNPQAFLEKRNELLNNGDESREKFDYEVKAFEYISAQYNAIKSEIPEELHDDLSELLLKKYTLVNKIKEVGDDVLNKKNKALLQDIDRRLEEMVDGNYDKAKETAISAIAEGRNVEQVKPEIADNQDYVGTVDGKQVRILGEVDNNTYQVDFSEDGTDYREVPKSQVLDIKQVEKPAEMATAVNIQTNDVSGFTDNKSAEEIQTNTVAPINETQLQDEQANPITPVEPVNTEQEVDNGAGVQQPDVNGGEIQQGDGVGQEVPTEKVEEKVDNVEIKKLQEEIDSFDDEYNRLVDAVNKEDRKLNTPKSENEIKLNQLQDKINALIDKRNKLQEQQTPKDDTGVQQVGGIGQEIVAEKVEERVVPQREILSTKSEEITPQKTIEVDRNVDRKSDGTEYTKEEKEYIDKNVTIKSGILGATNWETKDGVVKVDRINTNAEDIPFVYKVSKNNERVLTTDDYEKALQYTADYLLSPNPTQTPEVSKPVSEIAEKGEGKSADVMPTNAWGSKESIDNNFYTKNENGFAVKIPLDRVENVNIDGIDFHVSKVDGDWKVIEKNSGLEVSTGKLSNTKKSAIEDATYRISNNGGANNISTISERAIKQFTDSNLKLIEAPISKTETTEQKLKNDKHDRLVGLMREYNSTPTNKKTRKLEIRQSINKLASDLGYTVKGKTGDKIDILNAKGKEIRKINITSDEVTVTPEVIEKTKELAQGWFEWNGNELDYHIDASQLGLTWQEIRRAKADIDAGKTESTNINRVANAINEYGNMESLPLVRGFGGNYERIDVTGEDLFWANKVNETTDFLSEYDNVSESELQSLKELSESDEKEFEQYSDLYGKFTNEDGSINWEEALKYEQANGTTETTANKGAERKGGGNDIGNSENSQLEKEKGITKTEQAKLDIENIRKEIKDNSADDFNLFAVFDPKREAQRQYNSHVLLVKLVKAYINLGVASINDIATKIGISIKNLRNAFDEATGKKAYTLDDMLDTTNHVDLKEIKDAIADTDKKIIGKAYDKAQQYLETTDFNFDTDQRDAFIEEIKNNPALKAMFTTSQLEKIYEALPLNAVDKVKIKYKLLVYNLKADNRANKAGLKQQQKDMVADITTLIKGNLGGITGKQAEKLTNLATTAVEKNSMVRLGKIINHITNLANQRVYNRAKDLHQIIKSRSKRKGGAQSGRLTSILQEMATINPAEVSDINRYVELAERVKLASNPVLKPTDAETSLVYDEVQAFVKAEHEEINRNAVKDLAEGDNALTFFTVLDNKAKAKFGDNTTFDDLTEQQQREVVESITKDDIKKYNLTEDEQQMLEAFREQKKEQKRQDFITETYKKLGELKDLLAESAGVITQTPAEKQITDAILDAKLDDMSASEMARLLKLINNITQNNDYSGGTAFVSSQNAEKSLSKVKALSDKIKGFNSLTKSLSFFRNLQQIGVAMAKGKRLGAELMEAMGINDVVRGIAKTKTYAHDNLMDFKAQNFSNKVFDPLSQMRQTIYAAVMQTPIGADINEAAQVQRWRDIIQSNIDNLRLQDKKEFTEQADLLQKAFDQIIGDSQSMKDVAQNMTTIDKEGEMVVQFFIDKHAEQKPRFRENSLLYHNNEIDEYDNYTKLNVTSINSVDGGGKGADLMEHKGVKSLARKKSKSMIDRQKYETLDATKTLDFNFINKQFKALTDNEYDINTSAAIETAQILFKPNNEELRKLLGSDNRNLLKEKMQIILSASQFAKSDILDDVSNELAQTSRAIALGSVSQGLKQATVLVSTLANAGGIDFTMYTGTPEQKNNIDKLLKQSEIGARRAEGAGGIYDTTNITKKITDSQALKFLKALRRGKADLTSLSMYVLRNTDVAVADISWLTYYKKYLQDKGLSFDDQFEYKNPNKDAMAYAETMVQTTQGANTEAGQAEVWEKWKNAAKIFMPFMSFSLQGKLRMIDNTQNLFSTKDARTEAVRDMIGFTIEQTSFNAIKALLGYYVVGGLADVISHTLGYEDDDELAKKRKKEQAIESFYNNAAKDVTYGSIPLVDEATQRGMNAIFKGSFGTNVDLIPIYTNEQANVFKTGTLGALSMQLENTKKAWDVINGNKTFGDYTLNQQATKYKYKNDKGEENTYTIVHSNGYANKDDFFKKKGANYNNGSVPDEVLLEFALNPRKFEVVEELTPEKTTTTDSNLALDVTPEQKAYAAFIFATNVASLIGLNETMITQMNNKVQKKIIRKTIKE